MTDLHFVEGEGRQAAEVMYDHIYNGSVARCDASWSPDTKFFRESILTGDSIKM